MKRKKLQGLPLFLVLIELQVLISQLPEDDYLVKAVLQGNFPFLKLNQIFFNQI